MAGMELLLLSLHILYFSSRIYAFNLDTSVPIIKAGIPGSYFGFSVAQHQITDKRTGVVTDNRFVGLFILCLGPIPLTGCIIRLVGVCLWGVPNPIFSTTYHGN